MQRLPIPDVSRWNTARVSSMRGLFAGATHANPDVSNWNTAGVADMRLMFAHAQQADPDMSRWNFSRVWCYSDMFRDMILSAANYTQLLIRIAATSNKQGSRMCRDRDRQPLPLDAGDTQYEAIAAEARATLVTRGWIIRDGGQQD